MRNRFVHRLHQITAGLSIVAIVPFSLVAREAPNELRTKRDEQSVSLKVQVRNPSGQPIPNVCVVTFNETTNIILHDTLIQGGGKRLFSDDRGFISLPLETENFGLMISIEAGFCLGQTRDLTNNPVLVVKPWGCIKGLRRDHDQPLIGHKLSLEMIGRCVDPIVSNLIDLDDEATTDSSGSFIFTHVPPVEVWLQDVQPWLGAQTNRGPTTARQREIDMEPGATQYFEIKTSGRTVKGQIELHPELVGAIDFESLDESLARELTPDGFDPRKRPWVPREFDTTDERSKWYIRWFETDEGRQRKAAISKLRSVMIQRDGSFIAQMVEPGSYVFDGNLRKNRRIVALLDKVHVVVPPSKLSEKDLAVDVGKVMLRPVRMVKAGDRAPDFSVPSLDGSTINLSRFRGKYVLLDFWATWCGPCVAEIPRLKAVYEMFGKNSRFVMISLSNDSDRNGLTKFVESREMLWRQGILNSEWEKNTVAQSYGIMAIPQIVLISPEGTIIARDLRGENIGELVAAELTK